MKHLKGSGTYVLSLYEPQLPRSRVVIGAPLRITRTCLVGDFPLVMREASTTCGRDVITSTSNPSGKPSSTILDFFSWEVSGEIHTFLPSLSTLISCRKFMVALSLGAMIMPSSLEIRIDNLTFLSFSNALTSWYALSKSSGFFGTLNRVSRLGVCSASSSESVSTLRRFTPPLCRGLRPLEVGAAVLAGTAGAPS